MNENQPELDARLEGFLAELVTAAYGVALRHGGKGPFIDLELAIWRELRQVVQNGVPTGVLSILPDPKALVLDPTNNYPVHDLLGIGTLA